MRNLILSLLILSSLTVWSQESKKIAVAIPGFRTSNNRISDETVSAIHQRVIDAFVGVSKFSVVERNQLEELQNEVNLQKSESFMEGIGNVSDQVKNTGANYLVTGVISRLEYSREEREKKQYDIAQRKNVVVGSYSVYFCTIELNIKLIDVTNSQILLSEVISAKNSDGGGGGLFGALLGSTSGGAKSNEEAYTQTLDDISFYVRALIRKAFPNILSIAEISSRDRKGNADELLLVGDFTDGIGKKQELYVKLVTETVVNGKKLTRKKVIGQVKILKVEEGGFITVRIKSGEEEITKAFEEKLNIQITENQ